MEVLETVRCRHCNRVRSIHSRGLCRTCHRNLDVRSKYESENPKGRRGVVDRTGRRPLPDEPTAILPGPAKVPVLAERARLGQDLWHPYDAVGDYPYCLPGGHGPDALAPTLAGSSPRRTGRATSVVAYSVWLPPRGPNGEDDET
jgi:hypothetical protein